MINLGSIIKIKNILIILFVLLLAPSILFAQNYSIKLVFKPGFYTSFQNVYWQGVDSLSVKNIIINIVNEAYNGYFPVSVVSYPYTGVAGDVIAYIGTPSSSNGDGWGNATTGIGSYYNNSPASCDIYVDALVADTNNFRYTNATDSRIGRALGRTVVHEIGHLFNLYHAYMYDSYDPTFPNSYSGNHSYPNEPTGKLPVWNSFPTSSHKEHFMTPIGTGNNGPANYPHFVTENEMATVTNLHFSDYSKQVLRFARDGGGYVNRSMMWGVPRGEFYLNSDVLIDWSDMDIISTFYVGAGCGKPRITTSVLYLNNHKIRVIHGSKIEIVGSVSPNFINLNRGSILTGIYPNVSAAITDAQSGETIYISGGTHTINSTITIPAGVTLVTNGATLNFASNTKLVSYGKLDCSNTTFTGSNWKGIELHDSTSNGSKFYSCTISQINNPSGYALAFYNN